MKNLYLFTLLASVWAIGLNAQTSLTNPTTGQTQTFHFELLVEAPIFESNILGNLLDTAVYVAPKGAVFSKIDTKGDNIIMRFWLWQKDPHKMHKLNYADSTKTERKYFLMATTEFNTKAIPRHSKKPSFTLGATSIPMRIRTSPFDFSGEFSFGTSFGAKLPLSNYREISLNLVGGLHISHITFDSIDTRGAILSTSDETAPALTPVVGAVFEFSKAQIGLYIGWDLIAGDEKEVWRYQGKPWISIGVGTSIFNSSSTAQLGGLGNDSQP